MDINDFLVNKVHIVPGSSIVLGVSGGPDSMALLSLVLEFSKKVPVNIIVGHVNHKVRKESDDEEIMVREYCLKNNVTFECMRIEKYDGYNFHAEARDKRYKFFNELIKKYNAKYLFTAHHGDDLIETVIMRLIRGSTLHGYAGIEDIRSMDGYLIVRPLLKFSKKDLIDYVNGNNIPYAIDASNKEDDYLRNRIRNHILPVLRDEDNNIQYKFIKYSNLLLSYYNYVNNECDKIFNKIYVNNKLDIKRYNKLDSLIKDLVLQKILFNYYGDNIILISDSNMVEINKCINSKKANSMIDLPNNMVGIKEYNSFYITLRSNNIGYDYIIDGEVVLPNDRSIFLIEDSYDDSNYIGKFNSSDIKLPLHVRNKKDGDYIVVRGINKRKKVSDILINEKIPLVDRNSIPVVYDDSGTIVWLPGIKKSSLCKKNGEKYDIILRYR